jgi:cation diffusion facilitator CzcD-associated flavoprotein CzcO
MNKDISIAIIGSGFGGIGAAIKLKKAGFHNIVIYEKAGSIGGTWRDNTYPGAACDVMSHLYSFSFARNPNWSRTYSPQSEILDYLVETARGFKVDQYVKTNCEIDLVEFDEDTFRWQLTDTAKNKYFADVVISALGQLNKPNVPDFEGLDNFKGQWFHSARWNHDVEIAGKTVCVIGNAASAVQLIPKVAKVAKKLYVFQRTPNWIVPKVDREFSSKEKWAFQHIPGWERLYRTYLYWWHEVKFGAFLNGSPLSKQAEKLARSYLNKKVKDVKLREKLTPDYPLGCKRILLTNDYYDTIQKENVELVTSQIDHIEPSGIVCKDLRKIDCDVIIFATGFKATEFLTPMEVIGQKGLNINKVWNEGAEAYLGITMPGFPNFFMIYGPNTNLAHNSIIFMIECQISYIISILNRAIKLGAKALEPKEERYQRYNERIQRLMQKTVWVAGCPSWYKNESGKVTNNWPRSTVSYFISTHLPDWSAYQSLK